MGVLALAVYFALTGSLWGASWGGGPRNTAFRWVMTIGAVVWLFTQPASLLGGDLVLAAGTVGFLISYRSSLRDLWWQPGGHLRQSCHRERLTTGLAISLLLLIGVHVLGMALGWWSWE